MFAGVLNALLHGDYVRESSVLDVSSDLTSAYVTNAMIFFSVWLYSIQSSCLGYQYYFLPFQNTQTQGNLVKELHLSCYSGPRSAAFQICMRKRSQGLVQTLQKMVDLLRIITARVGLRVKLFMKLYPILQCL